jgi:6-phosphofructokinase 1
MIDKFGRALVVMSEGYDVGDVGEIKDYSGQVMFSSSENLAAQLLVNKCIENKMQARAFIPGVDQRSEIIYTTKFDINHAYGVGEYAVKQLESGESNFLVGIIKKDNMIKYHKIKYETFNDLSRKLDEKYIKKGSFDVSDDYLKYLEDVISDRRHLIVDDELNIDSFFRIDCDD